MGGCPIYRLARGNRGPRGVVGAGVVLSESVPAGAVVRVPRPEVMNGMGDRCG